MSQAALKTVATNQVAEKPKDLAALMASASVQQQIKMALPRHMTPERMARIATTEMRKNPKLMACDPMSFLGAVMQLSQLGLEPGGALGHAWILPFDKRAKVGDQWQVVGTEAQVIIGYRGMIDLARRSGQIASIEARAVYEGDVFDCVFGLESTIEHRPDWSNANRTDPAKLRFVYAVAKLKDGGVQFDVMSRPEIDAIRDRSQGYQAAVKAAKKYSKAVDSPWTTDYVAMAQKTIVRRIFKFLPVSIELATAVHIDEQADRGVQSNAMLLTHPGEAPDVIEEAPPQIEGDRQGDVDAPTYAQIADRIYAAETVAVLEMIGEDAAVHEPKDQRDELLQKLNARGMQLGKGSKA